MDAGRHHIAVVAGLQTVVTPEVGRGGAHRLRLCAPGSCGIRSAVASMPRRRSARFTPGAATCSGSTAARRAPPTWAPGGRSRSSVPCSRRCGRSSADPGPNLEADDDAPLFRLGLVGWLGYEVRGETTGVEPIRASRYPDAGFLRVDRALAIDRAGNGELLALGTDWDGELAEWRDDVIRSLAAEPQPEPALAAAPAGPTARWRDSDERYLDNVACLPRGDPRGRGLSALPDDGGRGRRRLRPARRLPRPARSRARPITEA